MKKRELERRERLGCARKLWRFRQFRAEALLGRGHVILCNRSVRGMPKGLRESFQSVGKAGFMVCGERNFVAYIPADARPRDIRLLIRMFPKMSRPNFAKALAKGHEKRVELFQARDPQDPGPTPV